MQQHQVLTGSANSGNHCYSVGQVAQLTFWAYGSGCDLVISSSKCHPLQVISGYNNILITALDCACNGKIAVAYGSEIIIYKAVLTSDHSDLDYQWTKEAQFKLDVSYGVATVLSWNLSGDKLLLGSSVISLWGFMTSKKSKFVSFHLNGDMRNDSDEEDELVEWNEIWCSGTHEHPLHLAFSPTLSSHHLFASASCNECLIKVWYSYPKSSRRLNVLSRSDTENIDFTFTYLSHPQPVVGFEWRKNLIINDNEKCSNILVSSCQDQICRIWVETKRPVSNLMNFRTLSSQGEKSLRDDVSIVRKAASTPLLSSSIKPSAWMINGSAESFGVRHFHIAATINPSTDIPLLPSFTFQNLSNVTIGDDNPPVFNVHWLNNKFYQHQLQKNNYIRAMSNQGKNNFSVLEESLDEAVDVSFVLPNEENKPTELNPTVTDSLVKLWRESRDGLFSIHPSDGSLLVWHIDWLDEDKYSLIRQPQVCFSSRIPMVFSSGDAATLCPRVILFVNQSTEQNLLHSASSMSFQSDKVSDGFKEMVLYSDVKLLSKHIDGSLNVWQISFSDLNDFSSITSITHSLRLCGHCFHMSGILSHPVLPLLVTTATHSDSLMHETHLSELILWRMDPIGALSYSGGLSELARVNCEKDHLFTCVSWLSLLFPNWSLGFENKSPSTGLIALTANKMQIYQVVVNANQILSEIMTPTSDNQSSSRRNVISQQSSSHPGCLLHLHTEVDESKPWGTLLFLDAFDVNLLSPSIFDDSLKTSSSKFMKNYYVVMVETSSDGTYIHTWLITLSATLSASKSSRHRKTTIHIFDSSEDESEEEISPEVNPSFSSVKVDVRKLSMQKLDLFGPIVDTCSGVGKFNLFFMADRNEHVHAAPFHLCTLSANGHVHFWHCNISENSLENLRSCTWELWQPTDQCDCSLNNGIEVPYHISVLGIPVLIKAANNTLLACLSIANQSAQTSRIVVSIFECASSGGSCWKAQDLISYSPKLNQSRKINLSNCHLDWLSREDGSFFLAVGYDTHIQIYSLAPKDLNSNNNKNPNQTNKLVKQTSLDVHTRQKLFTSSGDGEYVDERKSDREFQWRLLKWTKLTELNIGTTSKGVLEKSQFNQYDIPVTVAWARDGILIVSTETEMHVFSQWLDESSEKPDMPKFIKQSYDSNETLVAKGLFEVASDLSPSLPQYHPLILQELLNCGRMAAVREILIHLAICINGDYYDTTCEQLSIHLSKFYFCDQLSHVIQLCTAGNRITPLPLHDLVEMHGKISSKFNISTKSSSAKHESKAPKVEAEPSLDELLAYDEGNAISSDDNELDEILGMSSNKKKVIKPLEHIDLSKLEPNYFGKEHCKVINEFLTRNQLPGLSSLDQMELMALVDTLNLANVSNLQQGSFDEGESENSKSINLSAGERGYAVSGSGAGSLDFCGIRFIMAMHNHLCLLNSLPSANKSALFLQGLNTCHFAWAFHSETEEEMLSLLPSVQRGSPDWSELRSFGVVWWIRSTALLRRLVEQLARTSFLKKNDPLDAALFYLALNKKSVLCGLFRTIKDERMHQFFQHNFTEDRWRRAALKNAFALMSKRRFEHAVAFFLLADAVQDAAEICIEKLKDFQLALLITRLRDCSNTSPSQLLKNHILPDELESNADKKNIKKVKADAFVRSMAYWTLGNYEKSLNTLLENVEHEDIADVFNFYMFLRSHPLLLRNKAHVTRVKNKDWGNASSIIENATDQERQLIFQTALVHLEAGCPMLALDCLSMLPKSYFQTDLDNALGQSIISKSISVENMIEKNIAKDTGTALEDVDWSQQETLMDDEELELDWSDEDIEEESDDASRPTIKVAVDPPPPAIATSDPETAEPSNEVVDDPAKQDVFAQHLKMTACFQVFVQELKAIANAYNADGGQLRTKLYTWLENASDVLHRVFGWENSANCSEGLNPVSKKTVIVESSTETDESPLLNSLGVKMGSSQAPSLHELILADNEDWKTRRSDLAQRRRWLVCHHNFLRTLLSYCILHDSAYGVLATVRMELLLLIQESLQEKNATRSLASPLPLPSDTIPLITSSIASCKTVVADPLTYLCHLTRDILHAILGFDHPPHPGDETNLAKSAMLCSQAAALSTCIFQSLSDTSTPSFRSQLLKADTSSLDGVLDGNVLSSSPGVHSASNQIASPVYVAPTSTSSQWPGVAMLQSMLNSEGACENRTKILILLCEVTVAVYMSLLIHGFLTHSTSLLYRLVNHTLENKMWNAVFGGGVKIPIKYTKSSSNLKQLASMNVSKLRERLNHKVLSASGEKRMSISNSSSAQQDSMTYQEKFVPPEISLWDWFLTKPFKIPMPLDEVEFDSDVEEEEEDDESLMSSSDVDDMDENYEENGIAKTPETDSNSYSWKVMRVAIIQVAINKLQQFLPHVGFDLNELGTNSPFLFAELRILQEWKSHLTSILDDCEGVPNDFLPSASSLSSGANPLRPAMLKYQVMLEPNHTPFTAKNKLNFGCKRLWHSLVKKEQLQEMFIKYTFENESSTNVANEFHSTRINPNDSSPSAAIKGFEVSSRIVHKENELVAAFCINNVNSNCIALASSKDIQEIDLSDLLASDSWTWLDDSSNLNEHATNLTKDDEFLMVSAPARVAHGIFTPSTSVPWSSSSQTGQGANILLKRSLSSIRRMESHPTLPYYVSGSSDGAVCMWEWGHQQQISQFQSPGNTSRISSVRFSLLGNKVCSTNADGYISLWQVSLNQKPYFKQLVHDRGTSDFCFMSSASVLATTGLSSSSRNVAVWDTLLPRKNVLVKDFPIYEQTGGACIQYLSRSRSLLVAGKNGVITTYDERCLHAPLNKFVAHDNAIKCMAIDPLERFYVTGSANGDIKIWDTLTHKLLHVSLNEHARTSLFKNFGSGTVQLTINRDQLYSCGADGSLKIKFLPANGEMVSS